MELLRRLPIIAFEDGLPPPILGPLTWLMVAHTAKTPLPLTCMHVNLILAATLQLASSRYRERLLGEGPRDGARAPLPSLADLINLDANLTPSSSEMAVEIAGRPGQSDVEVTCAAFRGCSEEDSAADARLAMDVARAALLRAAYGGMGGDVAMLHKAVTTWSARGAEQPSESLAWGARLRACAREALSGRVLSSGGSEGSAEGNAKGNERPRLTLEDAIVREALGGNVRPPEPSSSGSPRGGARDGADGRTDGGARAPGASLAEAELRRAMRGEGGLRWGDVPLSSLDFHCTNVLDQALATPAVLASLRQVLAREDAGAAPSEGAAFEAALEPGAPSDASKAALELGQRAMWACSSALNVKEDWLEGRALTANRGAAEGMASCATAGVIPPDWEHRMAATDWLRGVAISRLGLTTNRAVQAMRLAEEVSAKAQAAARASGSASSSAQAEVSWAEEAAAAAAAVAASGEYPPREASLLGNAWAAIGPRCRMVACETLQKLLANEMRQREAQQRLLDAMSPGLLLEAPPPRHVGSTKPEPHAHLPGLFLVKDFVSEAEEAALIEWCVSSPAWGTRLSLSLSPLSPLSLSPLSLLSLSYLSLSLSLCVCVCCPPYQLCARARRASRCFLLSAPARSSSSLAGATRVSGSRRPTTHPRSRRRRPPTAGSSPSGTHPVRATKANHGEPTRDPARVDDWRRPDWIRSRRRCSQ